MTDRETEFMAAIEMHSPEQMVAALSAGLDIRSIRGKPAIDWLTEMYTRSDRFPSCLRLLLERGATVRDDRILPILLDDSEGIRVAVSAERSLLEHRTTLVSAFTPLVEASLLHVACEYGNLSAAQTLIDLGADVNARSGLDPHGLNGHTPIFHTVNSNNNRSAPLLHALLQGGAGTDILLRGITWGKGYEWETTYFDVTPVSYAQCGLTPQMHRSPEHIYANIRMMLSVRGQPAPPIANVPNRYLQDAAD